MRIWDVEIGVNTKTFTASANANDVSTHSVLPDMAVVACDDGGLTFFDSRSPVPLALVLTGNAVNCASFHPSNSDLLCTGSETGTVHICDLRNLNNPVNTLRVHSGAVNTVFWHPALHNVVGSAAADRRVVAWDLSRTGQHQLPEDAADGPPEMTFVHAGHLEAVTDACWDVDDTVLSADAGGTLQIWRMNDRVLYD